GNGLHGHCGGTISVRSSITSSGESCCRFLPTLITSSISLRRIHNFERTRFARSPRNLSERTSFNYPSWSCILGRTLAQAKKPGSNESSNRLITPLLAFQKSKRESHSRQLRARVPAWEVNLSISRTSSAVCANRSDYAFASIPRTFSLLVTTSAHTLRCERLCVNSIG